MITSRDSFPDSPKTGTFQKQTIHPEILVTRLSAKEMAKMWIASQCFLKLGYNCGTVKGLNPGVISKVG